MHVFNGLNPRLLVVSTVSHFLVTFIGSEIGLKIYNVRHTQPQVVKGESTQVKSTETKAETQPISEDKNSKHSTNNKNKLVSAILGKNPYYDEAGGTIIGEEGNRIKVEYKVSNYKSSNSKIVIETYENPKMASFYGQNCFVLGAEGEYWPSGITTGKFGVCIDLNGKEFTQPLIYKILVIELNLYVYFYNKTR